MLIEIVVCCDAYLELARYFCFNRLSSVVLLEAFSWVLTFMDYFC